MGKNASPRGHIRQENPLSKEGEAAAVAAAFPDEAAYLAEVEQALSEALRQSGESVARYERDCRTQQQYIVDYRHEIDPKELFQNTLARGDIERAGTFAAGLRDKLAKLADSPYFARIDFRGDREDIPSCAYIGRFAFLEDADHVIYDWRAPISSLFYDWETGPASYEAPAGPVQGELTRKRQFQITGGELRYCLESSVSIRDAVLQRELSRTADEKMKTIISTIQREQNQIIRNEQAEVLIIQGVAGSGKTSIALHRIAYLLYRRRDRLTAGNVVIVSPNRVFGDYISGVLPELGEEPIRQMSLADIAVPLLEGALCWQPPPDPAEENTPEWAARTRFKSTAAFLQKLDEYLAMALEQYFVAGEYSFGSFSASAGYIGERYRAYGRYPLKRRLQEVASDILDQFRTENRFEEDLPKQRAVARRLFAMFRHRTPLSLYRDFYRWLDRPQLLVLRQKTLEWADVYPYLYVRAAFEGLGESRDIRHLVIDEMQDYTPVQYAVLGLLFPCKKTMLGDYSQLVNPHQVSTLEDIRQLHPHAQVVELRTSYRSTCEIIAFAGRILQDTGIEPVLRHGDPVEVVRCADEAEELEALLDRIRAFRQSGLSTMGIILKTQRQAEHLYQRLGPVCGAALLNPDSSSFSGGVSVTSILLSKGLEFDEVILPGATDGNYRQKWDRNFLYVACTRAMHRLTLIGTGQLSRLLPGKE